MIEDKATEKLKKRLQDWGMIVNAGAGKTDSQPKPKAQPDKPKGKKNERNK